MVVLTGLLSLVAKDALIDADVAIVAEMRLNDVIEINASRRPLRQHRRRQPKRRNCRNKNRQNDTGEAHQAGKLGGQIYAIVTGANSISTPMAAGALLSAVPVLPSRPHGRRRH